MDGFDFDMYHDFAAYCDDSGDIRIYYFCEGEPEWGADYHGRAEDAGRDWKRLAKGANPTHEGWDGIGHDELDSDYEDDRTASVLIASSDPDLLAHRSHPLGVDIDSCKGASERAFAVAAGALPIDD